MYCTSLGKAILAFTEEEVRDEIIDKIVFVKKTEQTLTTKAALKRELEQIAKRGYAFDAREAEEHMECVGAPVFDSDGNVFGAISVSSLYKPTEDYNALGRAVREKAREVSKLMGFLGKI